MKQITVTVKPSYVGQREPIKVSAYLTEVPGLVVHKLPYQAGWYVSHQPSGYSVGANDGYRTRKDAISAVDKLGTLPINWEQNQESILHNLREMAHEDHHAVMGEVWKITHPDQA